MKKFLPVALVLVVFSSGCTIPGLEGINIPFLTGGQVVQYEHDIIVIKSLEAVPSEIDAGQSTKIIAYVQNIGDRAIGIGEVGGKAVEVELYDYCSGLFTPTLDICKTESGHGVSTKCTIDKILPGEIVPVTWTLAQNNGNIPLKTVCPQDGVKVLVKYPYETTALTTVTFISDEELERSIVQRDYWAVGDYMVSGQGPLKPYITVEDKQPVPVFPGARTVLGFQVKNMGQGYPSTSGIGGMNGNPISYTIKGVEDIGTRMECAIVSNPNTEIVIVGKESTKYLCTIDLSNMNIERRGTSIVEMKIAYDYIFTDKVTVTVNPKIAQ